VSKGMKNQQAWDGAFGANNDQAFQAAYARYWLSLPERPTQNGFIKVVVQTETSFLARAVILRQNVSDPIAFLTKYQPPDSLANRDLWLPPSLFTALVALERDDALDGSKDRRAEWGVLCLHVEKGNVHRVASGTRLTLPLVSVTSA